MADKIVGETNYGGEMVKFVVQTAKPNVPFQEDHGEPRQGAASRACGCADRERQDPLRRPLPPARGRTVRLHHAWLYGLDSPNRADAFVFAMSELFPGMVKEKREPKVEAESMYAAGGWQA
jgi:phage terminase large subunit-like protein